MLSSHGDFVSSWGNNVIKLTHYDETKKRAHDSQIVRAKENLIQGGPSYKKAPGTNPPIKLYARAVIQSEA